MIPIYVNHYKPLIDRKKYLEQALKTAVNVEWVTEPEASQITEKMENDWYLPCEETWRLKCKDYYKVPPFRKLKKTDISCSLGHVVAWQEFIDTNKPIALFLEDDAILCDEFYDVLCNTCSSLPADLDVLFIGGGFSHEIAKTKSAVGNFHLKDNPSTNCLCSYLMTRSAAERILKVIKPFTLPIDFEANYLFDELKFNVYHHVPYFVKEGTAIGMYKSTQTR